LIEGACWRQGGLDDDSAEWQSVNMELDAYGRALDVLLQFDEKRQEVAQVFVLGLPTN